VSEDYQSIPVAVARAAVQESGELEAFRGPEFFVQDPEYRAWVEPWVPWFDPTEDEPHPKFARAVITRRGQSPREVVIAWDEYAQDLEIDDPEWLEKRTQKPMSIFGAEVERHAYRVVFADVLAKLEAPARVVADANGQTPPEPWTHVRPWAAEVTATETAAALNDLYEEARYAGALAHDADLQSAFTRRLAELTSTKAPTPKPTPAPKPQVQSKPQGSKPRKRRNRPRRPDYEQPHLTAKLSPEGRDALNRIKASLDKP